MSILGITNRTENWKTAEEFAPFFTCDSARVALAKKLCESEGTHGKDIQIELFWKGVRDHVHKPKGREQAQVKFMVDQGWLKKKNILTWECIKNLAHDCNHKQSP